ncbi:alkylmercury lyase [Lentzea sp. PSKA42]|uniref:Alkylmercury lyase n=1 Tax=Lentzea indica TaxID=2604800 RepID=A0ABX1FIM1_9PSEU|nr:alkylmercury lyase [Lentzea indica]
MRVELLLAPDCPNAAAAKTALTEALHELELTVPVVERVGDFPSPTVLVDGVDVMNDHAGAPEMRACRLDVPTIPKLLAALRSRTAEA